MLLAGSFDVLQVDHAEYDKQADATRPARSCLHAVRATSGTTTIAKAGNAPIDSEALNRIGELYAIEAEISGRSADERLAERQTRTRPLVEARRTWLDDQLKRASGRSPIAEVMRYRTSHWQSLCRFLNDGGVEIDTNTVERSIRPIA